MKPSGPIVTLAAGAILAGGLVLANIVTSGNTADIASAGDQPAVTTTTPVTTPPATTAPATTAPAAPVTTAPAVKLVTATWAGHVDGGGASVAIVARNGGAIAYVCDGHRIEAWLLGTAADGRIDLTGKGSSRLEGTFGNGRATGTVRTKNKRWTFDVPAAKKPSGLYRSTARIRNATVDAGWIVLPDGSQVGIASTDGAPQTAPRLDTADGTATFNGTELVATPVEPAAR